MYLTDHQIDSYNEKGFLLLEEFFSMNEINNILTELPHVMSQESPRRIMEKTGSVRSVFKPELSSKIIFEVSQTNKLVWSAMDLLGSAVYIHQSKLNSKQALLGDWWEWHQDFLYWHKEDGMPSPRVTTAVIYLQDVNEFNGPMLVIPGSHKDEVVMLNEHANGRLKNKTKENGETSYMSTLTADLKYKVDKGTLSEMVQKNGMCSLHGKAGSILFFHGNLFHASANNLSPFDRTLLMFTYNSVENKLLNVPNPRPDFIASRDFSPIIPIS